MPICRLCLQDKKLIDAHIVPAGFYRYLYPDEVDYPDSKKKSLIMVQDDGHTHPRPIGEYDKNILCAECDNRLGIYDGYVQELLLKTIPLPFHKLTDSIQDIDYKKTKLFFLSLLWRASISDRPFFNKVDLGPLENKAREMIFNEDPGEVDDFSVVITKFKNGNQSLTEVLDKNITTPLAVRLTNGARAYIFYFPKGHKVYIKADSKVLEDGLKKMALSPNKPMIILDAGQYEKSPEFAKLLESVKKAKPKSQ